MQFVVGRWLPLGLCLGAILILGLVPVFHDPGNRDVAWLMYLGEALRHGAVIGRDYFENTPPLIVWLSAAVGWLGRPLGLLPAQTMGVAVTLLIIVALALLARTLRNIVSPSERGLILVLCVVALSCIPGVDYGQREHVFVVTLLPYLGLANWRLDEMYIRPSRAVPIGLLAGVGFAIKPHFALAWIAVEAYLVTLRGWRSVLRPESLAVVAVQVVYAAALLLFARPWLESIPFIVGGYAFRRPLRVLLLRPAAIPSLAMLVLGLAGRRRGGWSDFRTILWVANAGLLGVAISQGKGFVYHYLPALTAAVILSGLWFVDLMVVVGTRLHRRQLFFDLGLLIVTILALARAVGVVEHSLGGARRGEQEFYDQLESRLRGHRSMFAFTTAMHASFPTVDRLGLTYSMPFYGLWYLQQFYQPLDSVVGPYGFRGLERMSSDERWFFDRTVSALIQHPPDALVVEATAVPYGLTRRFDYLAYFAQDSRFRELFARYHYIGSVGGCDIYSRIAPAVGSPPPQPRVQYCLPPIPSAVYPLQMSPDVIRRFRLTEPWPPRPYTP